MKAAYLHICELIVIALCKIQNTLKTLFSGRSTEYSVCEYK